jgi:hypothetical protein
VVVGGSHFKLNVKVFHELLPEGRGELTVSVRDNRERVSRNSEWLVQKDMSSLLSIDILGYKEQVCIATEAIINNENELTFLVARQWTHKIQGKGLKRCLWNWHWPWLVFRDPGQYLVDLAKVVSVAEVHKVLTL